MRILLVIILLSFPEPVSAQEERNRRDFSFAPAFVQLRDYNLESVIHRGPGLALRYKYWFPQQSELLFAATYGSLNSRFETFGSSHYAQFHVSYVRSFWHKSVGNWQFQTMAGAAAQYRLAFFPNWDESHLYWGNTFSLQVEPKVSYWLGKGKVLQSQISFPLLAASFRPPQYRNHKIDDLSLSGVLANFHSHGKIGSWEKFFALDWQIGFQQHSTGYFYRFNYTKIESDISQPLLLLSHQIGMKWVW